MEATTSIDSAAVSQPNGAGFHAGHFALMGGAALVLLVLAVAQAPAYTQAKDFAQQYSGKLYANVDVSQLPSPELTQYALNYNRVQQGLTPVNPDGSAYAYTGSAPAVLGASTYDKSIPQKFSDVKVQVSTDTSAAAVQAYADQVNVVLTNEGAASMSAAQLPKLEADLSAIAVPSSIEDYQRLLVGSYQLRASGDPQHLAQQVGAVMETISASVKGSTNIQLPAVQ